MARPVTSAGLLLYRRTDAGLEVLLGHMGGPFWARKDAGAWTVPKGEHDDAEDAHDAAVREFTEELGTPPPPGPDLDLGVVRQRAGKTVRVWAREGDLDVAVTGVAVTGVAVTDVSGTAVERTAGGTFEIEWPPRSGRRQVFPELDRVRWVPVGQARGLVVAAQAELIDRLESALDQT